MEWSRLKNIWRYRELLRSLTVRNLKVKYQRSVLGFVWTFLNPLLTVAVLALVFRFVVRMQVPHYVAFLLSGYFVWNFMIQTISSGTYVLAEHAHLSRSAAFPKEIPVLAAVGSRLVEFAIEMTLVLVALALFHHRGVPVGFLVFPWLVMLQVLLALALTLPIATLSVFYHDVQHGLPLVLTTLFYLSPVFYPLSMIPEAWQPIFLANPLAQLLTAYHAAIYEGRMPSMELLGVLTLITVIMVWGSYALFNRHQDRFAEII